MNRSRDAFPDSLAAALADGSSIDWGAMEGAAGSAHGDLVRQLRVVAAMRARHGSALVERRSWLRLAITSLYAAAVTLAGVKVAIALAAAPFVFGRISLQPAGPFALNLAIFGLGGLLLIAGGGADRRLRLLGGLYLTIASAFVGPFVLPLGGPAGVVTDLLGACKTEAFFAVAVWLFAWAFPHEPVAPRTRGVAAGMVVLASVTAAILVASNFIAARAGGPLPDSAARALVDALDRQAPASMFWPLVFGQALLALPFLVARGRLASAERRQQVRWFLGALTVGLAPLLLASVATPFVPLLRAPEMRRSVGAVIYVALGSIVPLTAYAVTVSRVMTLEFIVRATLRYALARYAVWAAILAPLTYLALDVFLHRGLTFLQYVDARPPAGLIGLSGVGLVALTFRPQLARAVDRWFLREPLDPSEAMARLEHRFRAGDSLRALSSALTEELTRALHAEHARVLLLSEDGTALVAADAAFPTLPRHSVLAELLRTSRTELQLEARSAIARLLPEPERDWLLDSGAQLLAPLIGASGTLLGIVAIGEATSQLPYTPAHLSLVTTMCGHAALQLENRWLRQARTDAGPAPAADPTGVGWHDEPAAWCPACSETWSPERRRCRCGAATRPAVLPLFVNAKFRLERLLGTGGTGVVYLATDLALDRRVAIKTLPPMRREYAARLRREARAMAAVLHPNLATIYGAEEWHDTPLLIVEYLEGGTLLEWLQRGPAPVDEVLDLGIMLADVLDRIHDSGVLHRDIKPSNIGYTADGVPKLLDFGLAAMLDRSKGPDAAAAVVPVDPEELERRLASLDASSTLTVTQQVVGTPLYLSPEAFAGATPQESFDLWSLNMVLYEAIAGRHPFDGLAVSDVVQAIQHTAIPDIRDVRPSCPAPVAAFLNDALSRVTARRPQTAADLRTGLRGLRARLELTQ
ncbi:MAG: protein kinase [Vicinamibacterales bacterium]